MGLAWSLTLRIPILGKMPRQCHIFHQIWGEGCHLWPNREVRLTPLNHIPTRLLILRIFVQCSVNSGKSPLTLSLLRLINLDIGSIVTDGVDLTRLPHEYVRTKVVALPQQAFIMDAFVRLNVDPFGTASEADTTEALRIVQLWSGIEKKGCLDTLVDDSLLSLGEGQRLVFARAILKGSASQSKLLTLDEFTGR